MLKGVVCVSIAIMENFCKNIKQGHTLLLQQYSLSLSLSFSLSLTHTHTYTDMHKHTCMSEKNQECSYFLTACLPNSFQLLLGWESCYGNTLNTKSNMGLISEWTQSCSTNQSRVMRPHVLKENDSGFFWQKHCLCACLCIFIASILLPTVVTLYTQSI